jgi:outer membrane murein-binding lipoprotein Lpp
MSSRTNFAAPRAVLLHHHRAMHRPPLLLALALAAATGCVTKTKYDSLARDLETARAGLTGERDAARDEAARCGVQLGDANARADFERTFMVSALTGSAFSAFSRASTRRCLASSSLVSALGLPWL